MNQRTLIPSDRAQCLDVAKEAQRSEMGIVSRTVVSSPEMRVVLFAFADGQELTSHTSNRRALVQIHEGACEFLFDGKWHDVGAGSLIHLPPGHPHAVRASKGPFSMILTLGSEGGC